MACWSRERVLQFIDLYRSSECLWKVKSKDYSNRGLKDKAYEKLVQLVSEFDPEADRDCVVKKINNLRSSFRKELKKVESSVLSGAREDDIYVPRLWYFEDLMFLKEQEVPRSDQTANADAGDPLEDQWLKTEPRTHNGESDSFEDSSHQAYSDVEGNMPPESPYLLPTSNRLSSTSAGLGQPSRQARKRKRKALEDEPLNSACDRWKTIPHDDQQGIFGKYVADKLREMSTEQRIHAEKLISDVLYEGCLGNLSRVSNLVTPVTVSILPKD